MSYPIKSSFQGTIIRLYEQICLFLQRFLEPLLLLCIRFWMAKIFWKSGKTKIINWDITVSLFRDEYKTPFLSPEIAAFLATSVELVCPVLLVVGLLTRFSALSMLIMTAVIQLTYISSSEHVYWAILLGVLLIRGAGPLSIDYLLKRYCQKSP